MKQYIASINWETGDDQSMFWTFLREHEFEGFLPSDLVKLVHAKEESVIISEATLHWCSRIRGWDFLGKNLKPPIITIQLPE